MSGYKVYHRNQGATQPGRDTEYRLLAQVTGALMAARDNPAEVKKMVAAVLWNDRVWNAFLCDLTHEDNRLPTQLKGQLASLALWVAKETQLCLEDKGDITSLIEVNRLIMDGLRPPIAAAAAAAS